MPKLANSGVSAQNGPTVAQRNVRAKEWITATVMRYEVLAPAKLPERLGPVLRVIYLIFNEGDSAHSGNVLLRPDLSAEAS